MEVTRAKCKKKTDISPRTQMLLATVDEDFKATFVRNQIQDEAIALHQIETWETGLASNSLDGTLSSVSDEYYDDEEETRFPIRQRQSSSFYKRYGTEDHLRDDKEFAFVVKGMNSAAVSMKTLEDVQVFPETPLHFNTNDWQEILDHGFLEKLELVPSDDDLEKEGYKVEAKDWEETFFKVFSTKMRRSKLVLRTRLPKLQKSSRIRSIFMNDGVKLRNVTDELDKCHRATERGFNFQRWSYIICSEGASGSFVEDIEFRGRKYSFNVDMISAINPLCLWDFNAFWNTEKDFQVASDTSPYLSMMASQWKDALEADKIGRWIMLYEAAAVEFLKSQGETARVRAQNLKNIHSFSKLVKLVLSEYISRNKSNLRNGMVVKGREIVRSLSIVKKNEMLFLTESDLKDWLTMYDFVLNPDPHDCFLEMLNGGLNMHSLGFEQRLTRKTVFLCDPIHWTMCLFVLLEEKVKAMKEFLMETEEVKHKMGTNQKTSKITYTRAQVNEEIEEIKKFFIPLPKLKDLKAHVSFSSRKFIQTQAEKSNSDFSLVSLSELVNAREPGKSQQRPSFGTNISLRLGSRSHTAFSSMRKHGSILSLKSSHSLLTRRPIGSTIKRKSIQ